MRLRFFVTLVLASCLAVVGVLAIREFGTKTQPLPTARPATSTSSAINPCTSRADRKLQLFVSEIRCPKAYRIVSGFSSHVMPSYLLAHQRPVFPDHGWSCWTHLTGRGVQNFCLNHGATIIYFERFT